jgi:hypothetical protein
MAITAAMKMSMVGSDAKVALIMERWNDQKVVLPSLPSVWMTIGFLLGSS